MSIIHCISLSTGKDSVATACLALETQPRESLRFVIADTGNDVSLRHALARPVPSVPADRRDLALEAVLTQFGQFAE